MYYRIKTGFGYCTTSAGDVVLLDIEKGHYFALREADRKRILRLSGDDWQAEEADRDFQVLYELGFLEPTCPCAEGNTQFEIQPANANLSIDDSRSPQLWNLLTALYAQFAMAIRLRRSPLSSVLNNTGKRACIHELSEEQMLARTLAIVAAYEATGIFIGRTDRCLVRSLAMFGALKRKGVDSKLVIGVRTNPFAAHCWLQRGALVLNDLVERVRCFTPILVLE